MATDISICSNALLQLGKAPIASFNDGSDSARICKNLYPVQRDAQLRAFPWVCATKRVVLAPLADAPAFGYGSQFLLPDDFLRVIAVGDRYLWDAQWDGFTVEGRRILGSGDTLKLTYVYSAPEDQWDAQLVELMEARMLWKLAYPVTQSTSLRDSLQAEYGALAKLARAVDSQQTPSESLTAGADSLASHGRGDWDSWYR
jgi:hypothetical protein